MIVRVVKAFGYWKAETGYSEMTCAALGAPGCVKHSLILPLKKTCFSFSKFWNHIHSQQKSQNPQSQRWTLLFHMTPNNIFCIKSDIN